MGGLTHEGEEVPLSGALLKVTVRQEEDHVPTSHGIGIKSLDANKDTLDTRTHSKTRSKRTNSAIKTLSSYFTEYHPAKSQGMTKAVRMPRNILYGTFSIIMAAGSELGSPSSCNHIAWFHVDIVSEESSRDGPRRSYLKSEDVEG